jgi:hypothetical protein
MKPIDVDPELLRRTAEAAGHAYQQAAVHMDAEIKASNGVYGPLIDTLTPQGPYAYTIMPEVRPDGSVRLPVLTTREQIAEAYTWVRGRSDLLTITGLTEIRGAWYTFQDNLTRATPKGSGAVHDVHMLGLFPSGSGTGITGELIWVRVPRSSLGAPGPACDTVEDDDVLAREQVFLLHERYLEAMRAGDVHGVLGTLHDGAASAVRDYANDTGTLTSLEGADAHRGYYAALFDKYEIRSVVPLYRVTQQWYVFAELRVTASLRGAEAGGTVAFHTAEFFIPANDGRFIARIGHGTDPA